MRIQSCPHPYKPRVVSLCMTSVVAEETVSLAFCICIDSGEAQFCPSLIASFIMITVAVVVV